VPRLVKVGCSLVVDAVVLDDSGRRLGWGKVRDIEA